MSDFRFKISGDSSPFLAELYNATTCSKIASQIVEHSGNTSIPNNYTCVIFDGLIEESSYYVKVIDNVGNTTIGNTCCTPTNPVIQPTDISVNLLGTCTYVNSGPDESTYALTAPKCIDISPTPQGNQSITIPLTTITCSSTDGGYSAVDIFKCTSSSCYNRIAFVDGNETCNKSVTICEGDAICYNVYTNINTIITGDKYACGQLKFNSNNVTASGYGSCYNINSTNSCINLAQTCCTTTTTTTTTEPNIVVYMTEPDILQNTETNQCKSASLVTEPALSAGQSFTLNYEIINKYDVNESLPTHTFMEGVVREGATTQDIVATTRRLTGENTVSQNGSINVDSNNVGLIEVISCVHSSLQDKSYDYAIC